MVSRGYHPRLAAGRRGPSAQRHPLGGKFLDLASVFGLVLQKSRMPTAMEHHDA
jgi:hypothetical protein